ncbi:breast cancer anti-estrogen resistance protein 1-like isoform X2 [Littorina saxatilis]|uniref:Breast cancer anti-estrogen resistance protein 1 n=1 Tax=Littorina saxatilis TaxID=31220 RepID=A0AAN9BZW1_9CAEN
MTEEAQQMFLAKALYDNIAETPDELAFRRGDVITVMEQDTGGLDGWWLCSLRGRQGIAPGNRMKILSGMVDGVTKSQSTSDISQQEIAKKEWRRSLEKSPNKVVTPVKKGDVYLYSPSDRSMEDYDVPPSRYFPSSKDPSPEPGSEIYDTPTNLPAPSSVNNSFYDTPPSSKRASSERTPPGSQRASMDSLSSAASSGNRLSGDLLQHNLYQTPPSSKRVSADSGSVRLSGGERHYETPPGSKRASVERTLSDDQPTYDTPTSSEAVKKGEVSGEATYDHPNPKADSRRQSRESSGMGSSNRASAMSTASSESCLSASSSSHHLTPSRHSNAASLPDSARSSLDASLHEPYDLPPRESRALKQLSMDSGLGLYDCPGPGRNNSTSPQPPHHFAASSSQLSEYAKGDRPPLDIKRSRSLEHALDDMYDSPRNNAAKVNLKSTMSGFGSISAMNHDPNAVYDIPPQVTRDSVISARSDSSDESVRLSSCSMDSRGSGGEYAALAEGVYEELLLDLDSALELLVKLQQNVTRAVSRLLAFVSSTWRSKQSLQSHVYDIKVACMEMKKALTEFVDFAQGTLANSARLADRKLVNRLVKQVTPLQQQRKAMSASLRSLEEMKWQVALLAEPLEAGQKDDLGSVISLVKDLVPDVKKLASFIQGNSTLLFKRSSDFAAQRRGSADTHVASKPPIGPKPELAPKPIPGQGGVIIQRPRSMQQRPLPAPPVSVSERPLPLTPMEQRLRGMGLIGSLDNLSDYMNVGDDDPPRRYAVADDDDDGDRDYSDLQQEYDYVQLETCDVAAQQKSKDQQLKDQQKRDQQIKDQLSKVHDQINKAQDQQCQSQQRQDMENIREEVEPPDTPTPDTNQCSSFDQEEEEKKAETESEVKDTKPEPVHHTERMSADLGNNKHPDIDTVPTKENAAESETISYSKPQNDNDKDIPDGLPPSPESPDDLKTPVNKMNGFNIPNHPPPPPSSGGFDLNGTSLDPSDKQVLYYYSGQLETNATLLTNAIDAFFNCIENNEPPKVFISNSKFVIVTAHKLVYISDALHRSLMNCEVRNKVMLCANHVCECLKVSVAATKTAALQWPSVPAVQEMVDRVVDVSHAAHELKLVITQASAL